MANIQSGYGHSDVWGVPFDFYSGAVSLATAQTLTMQTGLLVLNPAGAVTEAVVLPLNPPDGAWAEVTNAVGSGGTITMTVTANTGDVIVGTAVTSAAMTAGTTYKYRYSLNGVQVGNTFVNPRSWIRIS